VQAGRLRAIAPETITYRCTFDLVTRRDQEPVRLIESFLQVLRAAHGLAAR
jgi:hypothetical protein